MNTLIEDLKAIESALQCVLQSPGYADMVASGHYNPDLSLLDALHAVQQCIRTNNRFWRSLNARQYGNKIAPVFTSASHYTFTILSPLNYMTKPLGHYTNYIPGDEGLLTEIQEQYGAQLQNLSRVEKLFLIVTIAADLFCTTPTTVYRGADILELASQIKKELTISDLEGFLECLINGVRYQK